MSVLIVRIPFILNQFWCHVWLVVFVNTVTLVLVMLEGCFDAERYGTDTLVSGDIMPISVFHSACVLVLCFAATLLIEKRCFMDTASKVIGK